jgi:LacI family transcriptional regulator
MCAAPAPVTLTRVAAAAGVSLATTSYALRHDRRISRATTLRVREAARRLGYRPNPRVSALMAHIRQAQPVSMGERIAFLWIDAPPGERPYPESFRAANERAVQLGYSLEEFWLATPGVSARRLQQILHTRGITGLLISPRILSQPKFSIAWNWSLFAPAVIGTAEGEPELHHSAHHHYEGMRLALLKLQAMGKRRIVGLLNKRIEERARRAWSAAFLAHHPLGSRAWEFLAQENPDAPTPLAAWIRRRRPDAIVGLWPLIQGLLHQGWRPSRHTTVVLLDWVPNPWGFGGIDQGDHVIAANAVDLVAGQLQRNERGVPADVKMLLFAGRWASAGTENFSLPAASRPTPSPHGHPTPRHDSLHRRQHHRFRPGA